MKTIVIYCLDPRAADIPRSIAAYFGDEIYPGEALFDEAGNRTGHTSTLFGISNAGGRAFSALHSLATTAYLAQVQRVIVVHHSFCGAAGMHPDPLEELFHVNPVIGRDSRGMAHFEESIQHDVAQLRNSPAVPSHVQIYGFFYEISSGKLTEVARNIPA